MSLSLFGITLVCLGVALSVSMSNRRGTWTPSILFGYHLLFAVYFADYTNNNGGDSWGYYITEVIPEPTPGTAFVKWATANIRNAFDATFLDCFMLYHLPGYVGIIKLLDLLKQVCADSPKVLKLVGRLIWLPGLHFWTSSIGKDSLSFFGITTFIVSAYRSSRLSWGSAAGLMICAAVRPHIALFLGSSWGLALIFGAKTNIVMRVVTLAALGGGAAVTVPLILDYLHIDGMDADSINNYVELRQSMALGGGSSVDIGSYPFPLQFFTIMFRPLFFDASGALGLVVSFENALYLYLLARAMPRFVQVAFGKESSAFNRMNVFFWAITVSLLGSTIANLGLAIRQKAMVMPSFLLFTLTAIAIATREKAAKSAVPATPSAANATRMPLPLTSRKAT